MAKAVTAQARGRRPATSKAARTAGGKAARTAKARPRRPGLWAKMVALVILFPFAAVLLPTTLVFFMMMAPTWVAYITDRSRDKHLALTVGMLNFAGTLPAIIELWSRGQSHQMAMLLVGDVYVWAVAYGAAVAGWGIFGVMPSVVGGFYRMTTESRIKGLVKQQKALIAEWGHAVAEGIAPTGGDEEPDAEAEEDADEADSAEVEAVPLRRAK